MTSIVILNYNTAKLTLECVDSIHEFVKPDFEIIVVDNLSLEKDRNELIKSQSKYGFKLVLSDRNAGFGDGNMQGYRVSKGEFVLFLNSDTYFIEDAVTPTVNYIKNNPKVGVCTCRQIAPDGSKREGFDHFQGIRKQLLGKWFLEKVPPRKPSRKKDFQVPVNVDFIQGCFMLFNREAFEIAGGFDPEIFLFFEEMDVCKRLKDNGYDSVFMPSPIFVHIHGASTSKKPFISAVYIKSYLYVIKKNFGFFRFLFLKTWVISKLRLKAIFKKEKKAILQELKNLNQKL